MLTHRAPPSSSRPSQAKAIRISLLSVGRFNGAQGGCEASSSVWIQVWIQLGDDRQGGRESPADHAVRPLKDGITSDFPIPLDLPDKREVGSSTLPRPILERIAPQRLRVAAGFRVSVRQGSLSLIPPWTWESLPSACNEVSRG